MKRFFIGMLAFGALFAHAGLAQAGAISELTNSVINELEDDNFETFFDRAGTADRINVGDRFLGTIAIQAIHAPPGTFPSTYNPGGTGPTFTGVFAVEAAAIVNTADRTNVFYKPLGTTNWSAEFGLVLPDPVNANSMAVFFDDVALNDLRTSNAFTLQQAISSFVGTNRVWEFGMAGAGFANDGISDIGEFFVAAGALGTDQVGSNLGSITNLINVSLLENFSGLPLLPHDYLSTTAFEVTANVAGVSYTNDTHLQAIGNINAPRGLAFDFKTDTDLYIHPVPEPSSLVIFAAGAIGCLVRYRRRK